ncbi:hypothetical protein I7I53_00427 [Histoplasma capsulatum var. duboisii H88]|uniref:Uncharacterized protein n=1 Tax=Ajellomyces capsulatus (strain H88) TaxID=544711 RepID=A0A8A1LH54_AJEC8|nr:hypothetical protein I7I53_00427 [Histoplasma capsulatum var. duboisii H88]
MDGDFWLLSFPPTRLLALYVLFLGILERETPYSPAYCILLFLGAAREADGVFPWCIGDWDLSIDFPFLSFFSLQKRFLFLVNLSYLLILCLYSTLYIYRISGY